MDLTSGPQGQSRREGIESPDAGAPQVTERNPDAELHNLGGINP